MAAVRSRHHDVTALAMSAPWAALQALGSTRGRRATVFPSKHPNGSSRTPDPRRRT